ncbi:MAG: T9SS type A sorting domain-containing protein [Bacteroidota bacterium]
MNNFTKILSILALCSFIITSMNAQTLLGNCNANTASDGSGQQVNVGLQAVVTVQPVVTNCRFELAIVIGTVDGSDADADVTCNIGISAAGLPAPFDIVAVLPSGQPSIVIPVTSGVNLVCDVTFVMTVQIVGGSGCMDNAVFPVELTKFEATANANQEIELFWETASETENQGFEIERSREGKKWETLDFVKGAGTTLEAQTYAWTDTKPYTQDLNYYRLKQIDFDGTTEYSSIIVAATKSNLDKVTIAPNPADNYVNLQLGDIERAAKIEIYNSSGQLLRTIETLPNSASIDLNISDLPSSIYWITIFSGNDYQQRKLVKM